VASINEAKQATNIAETSGKRLLLMFTFLKMSHFFSSLAISIEKKKIFLLNVVRKQRKS